MVHDGSSRRDNKSFKILISALNLGAQFGFVKFGDTEKLEHFMGTKNYLTEGHYNNTLLAN